MPDDYFPQEMTANEKTLGFQLLVLEGFGLPDASVDLAQVPVVAKRLSPSDVLVKVCRDGLMFYSHRRFGRPAGAERRMRLINRGVINRGGSLSKAPSPWRRSPLPGLNTEKTRKHPAVLAPRSTSIAN